MQNVEIMVKVSLPKVGINFYVSQLLKITNHATPWVSVRVFFSVEEQIIKLFQLHH